MLHKECMWRFYTNLYVFALAKVGFGDGRFRKMSDSAIRFLPIIVWSRSTPITRAAVIGIPVSQRSRSRYG